MKLNLPAVVGGVGLLAILFAGFAVQGPRLWTIVALALLGLIHPRTRFRVATHYLSLCVSAGALAIMALALTFVASYWPMGAVVGWIWLSLAAAIGGFTWMFASLAVNRTWPESVPIFLGLGSLISWRFFLDNQLYGAPMAGLYLFLCTLIGGWMGCFPPAILQEKRNKSGGILAVCLAAISVIYTLALAPPGMWHPIRVGQDHWEAAYWVNGNVSGKESRYALLLGDHGHEPITVRQNFGSFHDFTKLTEVQDSHTIDQVYELLAISDNERLEAAVSNGSTPPILEWLWKLRRVPRRGSIWVASRSD